MTRLPNNLAWKLFERSLSLVVILSFCVLRIPAAAQIQKEQTPSAIERDKPFERSIAAGETQSYTLTLTAGQYAHLVVDQRGVDGDACLTAEDLDRIEQAAPKGAPAGERYSPEMLELTGR